MLRKTINKLIKIYQKTLSPDTGWFKVFFPSGACKFHPTCSEYTRQAINKYGFKGFIMGVLRITRCHPLSKGGIDEVK